LEEARNLKDRGSSLPKKSGLIAKVKRLEAEFDMIPTGNESAEVFGMLKSGLEKSGTRPDDFDLIIAACAMVHNLTLVTNNVAHFKRIEGLKLTNWSIPPV